MEPAAAGEREDKSRLKLHFVHGELNLPDAECLSRQPKLHGPRGRQVGV